LERTKDLLATFGKNFEIEYALAIVTNVKEELAGEGTRVASSETTYLVTGANDLNNANSKHQRPASIKMLLTGASAPRGMMDKRNEACRLEKAGPQDFVVHEGMMMKEGDPHAIFSTWKSRYFRALNAKDNYRVEYFDDEGMGKKCGQMDCCGFYTRSLSPEEKARFGKTKYGLAVVPYSQSRRTYHLKCVTEDDEREWKEVFTQACRKAVAPCHENALVAAAFKGALKATAWECGTNGVRLQYSEHECLTAFIYDTVWDELLMKLVNEIPAGTLYRDKTVEAVKCAVRTSMGQLCKGGWEGFAATAVASTEALSCAARTSMDKIAETKNYMQQDVNRVVHH
jgi:hypothetical protein